MAHTYGQFVNKLNNTNVVVQFYPWFKFYFPLFLDMIMYDNEFETKKNKIETKDETKPPTEKVLT